MPKRTTTRRDWAYLVGKRAARLAPEEAAKAWADLAARLVDMGLLEMPKFKHVVKAIRTATIAGREPERKLKECGAPEPMPETHLEGAHL